jgi:hypothetical protein
MEMEKNALGGDEFFQIRFGAMTHQDKMIDELEAILHHAHKEQLKCESIKCSRRKWVEFQQGRLLSFHSSQSY